MRRGFFISLSLVLALVGWSTVCAEDFYVIPALKGNYAPVEKTGQTVSYGSKDDGDLQKGVAWPTPRFTDHGNGTVTDNLTGLIWMKNASNVGAVGFGTQTWANACAACNGLKDGEYGLMDGSKAGDWRLPNLKELQSLVDYGRYNPALPAGHPFIGVKSDLYASSTTNANGTTYAWSMYFYDGYVYGLDKGYNSYVWCVRGGP